MHVPAACRAATLLPHLGFLQQPTQWNPSQCTAAVWRPIGRQAVRKKPARTAPVYHCAASPPAVEEVGQKGVDAAKEVKKTLAHPDYRIIQDWWHPTGNGGLQPGDLPHKSRRRVRLRCPGCIHGCGRHHEWEAIVAGLTQSGGRVVCPLCQSVGRGGKFCECRSVAEHPVLSKEWHEENPPAKSVAISSNKRFLWKCPKGHDPYEARCDTRSSQNSACPACFAGKRQHRHPPLAEGRPDLAAEWDTERNTKKPSQVSLGSNYKAGWVCRDCGSKWETHVFNRALQGKGCPACRKRFKPRLFGSQ